MKNEKIINSWNKIEPNDETKQKIFDDITQKRQRKNKRPRFNKIAIIAAVMVVVLMLMGAGAAIYSEMIYFDLYGNIRFSAPYTSQRHEMDIFEYELWENKQDNEVWFMIKELSQKRGEQIVVLNPSKTITDYEELKSYLNSDGETIFKLPEYIPDGYEFSKAKIEFNLDENIDYEGLERVYYEEKFGNIYEKYIFPEVDKSINSISVFYSDCAEKNEKIIYYNIHLAMSDIENIRFGGPTMSNTTESEILEIPQFYHSIIFTDDNKAENYTINNLFALEMIQPVNILHMKIVSQTWQNYKKDYDKNDMYDEFDSIIYSLSALVPRSELIKMAESIK
jgi:hypothetical protein